MKSPETEDSVRLIRTNRFGSLGNFSGETLNRVDVQCCWCFFVAAKIPCFVSHCLVGSLTSGRWLFLGNICSAFNVQLLFWLFLLNLSTRLRLRWRKRNYESDSVWHCEQNPIILFTIWSSYGYAAAAVTAFTVGGGVIVVVCINDKFKITKNRMFNS